MSIRFPVLLIALAALAVVAFLALRFRPRPVAASGPGESLAAPLDSDAAPGLSSFNALPPPAGEGKDLAGPRAGEDLPPAPESFAVSGEGELLAERLVPGEPGEWAPPAVSTATLSFIRGEFAKWRASTRDEQATADLRLALAGRLSPEELLAAAATLMRLGSTQDKIDAMMLVGSGFSAPYDEEPLVRLAIPDEENEDGEGSGSEADAAMLAAEEHEAEETHEVVSVVAQGLEDPDAAVRQAAYAAAMELSRERNNILLGQLLCSDSATSADLRRQLMDELASATDEESVSLLLTAMQSPDEQTAATAKERLESIAGRTFEDVLAAADWLEEMENPPAAPEEGGDADGNFEETTHSISQSGEKS